MFACLKTEVASPVYLDALGAPSVNEKPHGRASLAAFATHLLRTMAARLTKSIPEPALIIYRLSPTVSPRRAAALSSSVI